ncbi:MAG: SDR family NAD(P)-dependent oxidoreductase, partial [Pseudonocardiaceae bacterium]
MKGLVGKRTIVTGGSSGIGQAIAIRLGEEGVDVAINYVGRPEGAEATKDQIQHGVDLCMKQLSAAGTNPMLVGADVSDAAGALTCSEVRSGTTTATQPHVRSLPG